MKTNLQKRISLVLIPIALICFNVGVLISQNLMDAGPACVDTEYFNHYKTPAVDEKYCFDASGARCGIEKLCEDGQYFDTCQETRCKDAAN